MPQFLNSEVRRHKDWKVAHVPERLQNRHLDLGDVNPANTEHFTQSLMADVQGIQVRCITLFYIELVVNNEAATIKSKQYLMNTILFALT
jgi:hypothetical protein